MQKNSVCYMQYRFAMGKPGLWSFARQHFPQCFVKVPLKEQKRMFIDGLNLVNSCYHRLPDLTLHVIRGTVQGVLEEQLHIIKAMIDDAGACVSMVCIDGDWPAEKLKAKISRFEQQSAQVSEWMQSARASCVLKGNTCSVPYRDTCIMVQSLLNVFGDLVVQSMTEADDVLICVDVHNTVVTSDSDQLSGDALVLQCEELFSALMNKVSEVEVFDPGLHPDAKRWKSFCSELLSDTNRNGKMPSLELYETVEVRDIELQSYRLTKNVKHNPLGRCRTWFCNPLLQCEGANIWQLLKPLRQYIAFLNNIDSYDEYNPGLEHVEACVVNVDMSLSDVEILCQYVTCPDDVIYALEMMNLYKTKWTFRRRYDRDITKEINSLVQGKVCVHVDEDGFRKVLPKKSLFTARAVHWWHVYCCVVYHMSLIRHRTDATKVQMLHDGTRFYILMHLYDRRQLLIRKID